MYWILNSDPAETSFEVVIVASPNFSLLQLEASTALFKASLKLLESLAKTNFPPVSSAKHFKPIVSFSVIPKPITWAVKSTPVSSSFLPNAHKSTPQVSIPSETKIIVAFSSEYFKNSAAFKTESPIGVFPFGEIVSTSVEIFCILFFFGSDNISISLQSPFFLCP